jgi:hypothetical protein
MKLFGRGNPKMNCSICDTKLRISPAAGRKEFVMFQADELGGAESLIDELSRPARHVCPKCKRAYCPDCLPNMLCPKCMLRVHLG